MYAIDINFLNDRQAREQATTRQSMQIADSQFLIYGGVVAFLAVAIAGGYYFYVDSTLQQELQKKAQLDSEKSRLDSELAEVQKTQADLAQMEAKTNELLPLFVGQLPTYAILSDLSRRTPDTIQIDNFAENARAIQINGSARDYQALNDYLLLLKSSPFLDPNSTTLTSATLGTEANATVKFSIQTAVTSKRADELLKELKEAEATGLLIRLSKLKQEGIIK
jgi:type IV pilus assembly protein PilN